MTIKSGESEVTLNLLRQVLFQEIAFPHLSVTPASLDSPLDEKGSLSTSFLAPVYHLAQDE